MDTIFALASARGKAGVAVIRLSGPKAFDVGMSLAGSLPLPRQTGLRHLKHPDFGVLDDALVLSFAAGGSFTGEDVVEFQLHGSPAIISAVLLVLGRFDGVRLAEPGEFTRRALENGCLDLAQVEGLGDLIEAETEAQRKQALRVFEGALGDIATLWRKDLIRAVSLLEATIDFADEDIPIDVTPEIIDLIDKTSKSLVEESRGSQVAERVRDGFEVAIIGPPNVGKSTLLNRLAGREAAITSEIAGTTRDVIELRMDLKGLAVTFLDTAGIHATTDSVETLGVARARSRAARADLRVVLTDGGELSELGVALQPDDLIVAGKIDELGETDIIGISGLTGDGVGDLVTDITAILETRAAGVATATHIRHRLAIDRAILLLESARDVVLSGPERAEFASEDLHQAIRSLDSLIGKVDVEHVLDEIFASFCLGK